mgnify:CR=1 FL=1
MDVPTTTRNEPPRRRNIISFETKIILTKLNNEKQLKKVKEINIS